MKKTCSGCRALDGHSSDVSYRCELGYRIKNELHEKYKLRTIPKPLEECPKPRTIKEFEIEEEKYRNKVNNRNSTSSASAMQRTDLYTHSKEPTPYQRKVDWLLDHGYEQTPEGLTLIIIVPQRNAKFCFKHTVLFSELHDIDYDVLEAYDARVWAAARRNIIESKPR